jgi:hypothetical protein
MIKGQSARYIMSWLKLFRNNLISVCSIVLYTFLFRLPARTDVFSRRWVLQCFWERWQIRHYMVRIRMCLLVFQLRFTVKSSYTEVACTEVSVILK